MQHGLRGLFLVVVAAQVLGCGGGGGGGNPPPPGGGGGAPGGSNSTPGVLPADVILYRRILSGGTTVYRINGDGSGSQTYYDLPNGYGAFAHSPTAAKVAFSHTNDQVTYSVMVNSTVTTTGATTVDAGPYVFVGSVQFTPDGTRLVYVAQSSTGNCGLFVANADGTGTPQRLDDADDAALGFGGQEIAYSRVFINSEICLRKIDGTGFARVTTNAFEDFMPQWSKDGLKLYFTSNRSGGNAVWAMGWNGSSPARITAGNGEYGGSPNTLGTKIAFTRLNANPSETGLYTINADGTGESSLAVNPDTLTGCYWTSTVGRSPGSGGSSWFAVSPRTRRLIAQN